MTFSLLLEAFFESMIFRRTVKSRSKSSNPPGGLEGWAGAGAGTGCGVGAGAPGEWRWMQFNPHPPSEAMKSLTILMRRSLKYQTYLQNIHKFSSLTWLLFTFSTPNCAFSRLGRPAAKPTPKWHYMAPLVDKGT